MKYLFKIIKELRLIGLGLIILFTQVGCATTDDNTYSKSEENQNEISPQEILSARNLDKVVETAEEKRDISMKYGPVVDTDQVITEKRRELISVFQPDVPFYSLMDSEMYNSGRVSVNFDNENIRTVMSIFSDITQRNILVGDEVKGLVTVNINDEPWLSALKAILDMKGLAMHIDAKTNLIRIHDRAVLMEQEEYDNQRLQTLQAQLDAEKKLLPRRTEMFRLFYVSADMMKGRLEEILASESTTGNDGQPITSSDVSISADTTQNVLIISATKEDLDLIEEVIVRIDQRVQQILIEAIILEATDDFDEAIGARIGFAYSDSNAKGITDISGLGDATRAGASNMAFETSADTASGTAGSLSNLPVAGSTAGLGVIYDVGMTAIKAEIYAMQSEGLAKVISNPRVFTLDNQEAKIIRGTQIPYTSSGTSGEGQIQFKDAALSLQVTPQIVGDGNIIINLTVTNDSAGGGTNPPINKMEINTSLIISDGSVVAIGGIYTQNKSKTVNKVPLLGDIPILGHLFRSRSVTDDQRQILIFIAPKVIGV